MKNKLLIIIIAGVLLASPLLVQASFIDWFKGLFQEEVQDDLGALPVCRTEQGCTGTNTADWTGNVYITSGVWGTTTVSATGGADTDWTASGTTMYATDTISYVGIGTTSPAYLLDIEGTLGVDASTTFAGYATCNLKTSADGVMYCGTDITGASAYDAPWSISGITLTATDTITTVAMNATASIDSNITLTSSGDSYIYVNALADYILWDDGGDAFFFSNDVTTNGLMTSGSSTIGVLNVTTLNYSTTTNWDSAYDIVNASSSAWDIAEGLVTANNSNWTSAYTGWNASNTDWSLAFDWATTNTATILDLEATSSAYETYFIDMQATDTAFEADLIALNASTTGWDLAYGWATTSVAAMDASSTAWALDTGSSYDPSWIVDGTDLYSSSTYTKIGVGTTTPATTLNVYGTTTLMGGNVGVGTSNPAYTLDVEGSVGIDASTTFTGYATCNLETDASGIMYCGADDTGGTGDPTWIVSGTTLTATDTITTVAMNATASIDTNITMASSGDSYIYVNAEADYLLWDDGGDAFFFSNDITTNQDITAASGTFSGIFDVADYIHFVDADYGTYIGKDAGQNREATSDHNTALGYAAFDASLDSADKNTALGAWSLSDNTTGDNNTAVGYRSLYDNTIGADNTAIGSEAMYYNIDGINNIAIGSDALRVATSSDYNMAIGSQAQQLLTSGNRNVAMGTISLYGNDTGSNNVAIGYLTMQGVANTPVENNVVIGKEAGNDLTTGGDNNVLIGYMVADKLASGSDNIVIGYDIDTPAIDTSDYLNIGGAITGDLSTGDITITNDLIVTGATTLNTALTGFLNATAGVIGTSTIGFGDVIGLAATSSALDTAIIANTAAMDASSTAWALDTTGAGADSDWNPSAPALTATDTILYLDDSSANTEIGSTSDYWNAAYITNMFVGGTLDYASSTNWDNSWGWATTNASTILGLEATSSAFEASIIALQASTTYWDLSYGWATSNTAIILGMQATDTAFATNLVGLEATSSAYETFFIDMQATDTAFATNLVGLEATSSAFEVNLALLNASTTGWDLAYGWATTSFGWGDWNGNIDISTDTNLATSGLLIGLANDTISVHEGTMTDGEGCIYTAGTGIVCNSTFLTSVGFDDVTGLAATSSALDTAIIANTAAMDASSTAWTTNTTYTAGDYLTLTATDFDLDAEIYTETVNFAFANATTTDGRVDLYWSPGNNITITTLGCITDGAMVIECGECLETSLATTSQIANLSCDTNGASTTSFVDAAIAGGSRVKCQVASITSGTSTWATITYTIND